MVNLSLVQAYDAFMAYIWWDGGAPPGLVTKEDDERSGQGSIRSVPGGIHEKILTAEHGNFLEYTLTKNGPFPVTTHLGKITFKKEDNKDIGGDHGSASVVHLSATRITQRVTWKTIRILAVIMDRHRGCIYQLLL